MSRVIDLGAADTDYVPPAGLRHPDAQSMLSGSGLRRVVVRARAGALLNASRATLLQCRDGARLLGYLSRQPAGARGLIIILHGWEGCSESNYVLSVGAALYAAGFDVFRLNLRDHGNTQALNEELFHSCRIGEVVDAVTLVSRDFARARVGLVGYSLGGNFALRVAVRAGEVLTRVVAVCPVLNPRHTMHALEHGLWVYRRYFLNRWRRSLTAKAAAFPDLYEFGDLRRFRTLTKTTAYFVRHYTDFPSLNAYLDGYAIVGSALSGLDVPSLIIAAQDDPVIPSADLAALAGSDALRIKLLSRGGHCAFLSNYRLESWADGEVVTQFAYAD